MRKENKKRSNIKKRSNVKKLNKSAKIKIVIAAAACLLVAGVSFTVYSKYYKTGFNPGMATASGFYFNSNYLTAVEEIMGKSMTDIAKNYQQLIPISSNDNSWRGENGYSFYVQIRNYDNHLLYNDQDLNVEYEVSFMLLEDSTGIATYTVSKDGVSHTLGWQNGQGTIATFNGKLKGGQLSSDEYQLSVNLVDADRYTPAGVLIVARPTGPSYLQNTKWIASIMKVNYEEKEFRIEKAGFVISNYDAWQDEAQRDEERQNEWKKDVEKEAGYVYQVYTTGNNTGTGTRKTIELRWRDDLFKINNFDQYYQQIKADLAEDGLTINDPNDKYYVVEKNGAQWRVMKMEVLPYSSLKFVFYRKATDFMGKVDKMSIKDFKDTVEVEIID